MDIDDKDPILDSLLDEVVAGRAPPDLTARILQSWAARRYGHDSRVQQLAAEEDPAAPPILHTVTAALKQPTSSGDRAVAARPTNAASWTVVLTVSLAATVIGLGLTIGLLALRPSQRPQVAQKKETPSSVVKTAPRSIASAPQLPAARVETAPALEPPMPPAPQIVQQEPESPRVAAVPSPASPPQSPETAVAAAPRPRRTSRGTPSSETQIVSFVNAELNKSWKEAGVKPTPAVSDAEWCERLFVRVLGRAPTADEQKSLAGDKSASRREKLVDKLLTQSSYADELSAHWSEVLTNVFLGKNGGRGGSLASRDDLQKYFAAALHEGKAYDVMAQELLTASGAANEGADDYNPAVNFLLDGIDRDAKAPTARVARVLLGHHLQCAQCHDSEAQGWKQQQFWALNAALRQLRASRQDGHARLVPSEPGVLGSAAVAYQTPEGITKTTGPRFIDGTEISATDGVDPRQQLAELIVESNDFAKAAVNRVWAQLFDYGFARPVDDFGPQSTIVAPAVLDRLATEFAAHDFDLRRVIRWAVLSEPFRRSSQVTDLASKDMPEEGELALFSRFYNRPAQGPRVLGALVEAGRIRAKGGSRSEVEQARVDWLIQANRAPTKGSKKADTAVMVGSADLQHKSVSGDPTGLVKKLAASEMPLEKRIEHLFLAALARQPSQREQQAALQLVRTGGNPATALEDLWWALQNSSECVLDR
jgi:hypothetical protein